MMTYETTQPWVVYHYGLTHDKWWPFWNSTRVLGLAKIRCICSICGDTELVKIRVPRVGNIPDRGHHPRRTKFLFEHVHPDRPHPMSWKMPLLNPGVHQDGIDLDLLAMRLQADLNSE